MADELIFQTDYDGKFLFVNPATLKTTGYNSEELFRTILFKLIPPEYSNTVKEFFSNQIKNKIEKTYFEFPITCKSGRVIWLGQSTVWAEDVAELKGLQCIARDITPRKLVEQETLMLAKILEQTTEMILITDKKGIVQYVNSAFEKITQYTKWEIIGKRVDVLRTDEETQQYIDEAWGKVLNGQVWRGIIKNRKKDGTVYDEELTINPVFNEFGVIINIVEIKRDISEEIKQKDALSKAEERFKSLFENAIEGIYQSSVDGKLLMANRALLEMLGYESIDELESKDLADIYVNPEDRAAFQKIMDKDGKVIDYEIKLKRKDGFEIFVLENSRAVTDNKGNIIYYEGIIQDITKRKETENAIRKLIAQKDKFLSIVSHDLRAPFNSILGFTEILLDETSEFNTEEKKEFLVFIKQAAEQQLNLLGNLLDWSRIETGRIRFEPKPTDLKMLVEKSIISLKGNALRKQINLYSNIQENITVNIDENLTLQLFGNLLSNALKFTPQNGSVWVDINDSRVDFVSVSVNDNGIGIPHEDFDKLFRIDTKYYSRGTEGEEGSGLGLALCAEIVKKHGGKIEVKSELNKGTSFIFNLPAVRKSVLIVDDNKGDRSLAMLYVQQLYPDIIVIEAHNGYEAMSLTMSRIPSIVLADFAMPGMDGLRLLQELKQQPQTRNIPVIIITSFESKADAVSLTEYGVTEILIKPIAKEELQQVLAKYI